MSIYDELILEGKIEGKIEAVEQIILNAFDIGIELQLIKVITGESIEAIQEILRNYSRIEK